MRKPRRNTRTSVLTCRPRDERMAACMTGNRGVIEGLSDRRGREARGRSPGRKRDNERKRENGILHESAKERKREIRRHGRGGPVGTARSLPVYLFRVFALSRFRAKCRFAFSLEGFPLAGYFAFSSVVSALSD